MFTSALVVVCATVLSPVNGKREGFYEIFTAHRTAVGKLS
jgi:hypothetical protein